MCTASLLMSPNVWFTGGNVVTRLEIIWNGYMMEENNGTEDVPDVSVVLSCPVMIKVVISAAGVRAFRSCSAVGFCFLVSSAMKAM